MIILIHTNGDWMEYTYYRCISLLSLPGKVYAKCLETRYREIIEQKLGDTQCCFRPSRSTTDQFLLTGKFSRNLGACQRRLHMFC